MVAIAPRRSIASFKSHHAQACELSITPWTHLPWHNVMLFLSGSLRAGGTNKSITPWRLYIYSNATRLQTAPTSSLAFPGVFAKQRWSIPPLHTSGSRKSAVSPFHFTVIFAPPFLAGYSNYHPMKERWHKSNPSIIAIVLGAQLLLNNVSHKGNNSNNTDETWTCRQHPSCAGAREVHIVSRHIDKQQSTDAHLICHCPWAQKLQFHINQRAMATETCIVHEDDNYNGDGNN